MRNGHIGTYSKGHTFVNVIDTRFLGKYDALLFSESDRVVCPNKVDGSWLRYFL